MTPGRSTDGDTTMASGYHVGYQPMYEPLKGHHHTFRLFVTFGASGAVSASEGIGATIAKTAGETGRYTITLSRPYKRLLEGRLTLIAGDDAALTAAAGNLPAWRDDDIATDGTIELQMWSSSGTSAADAEPTSGHKATITVVVSDTDM